VDDVIAQLEPLIAQNGDAGIRKAVALWRATWKSKGAQDCLAAFAERYTLVRRWQQFLEERPLIVMPVSTELPFPVGSDVEDERTTARILEAQRPLTAISVLGLPAVSVATGATDGVPLGVQVVAGRYREDLCLDAAEVIETAAQHLLPSFPVAGTDALRARR
jgi:amidase